MCAGAAAAAAAPAWLPLQGTEGGGRTASPSGEGDREAVEGLSALRALGSAPCYTRRAQDGDSESVGADIIRPPSQRNGASFSCKPHRQVGHAARDGQGFARGVRLAFAAQTPDAVRQGDRDLGRAFVKDRADKDVVA